MLGYVNPMSSRGAEAFVHRPQTRLLQGGHFCFSLQHEASVGGAPRKHAKEFKLNPSVLQTFETKV